jgi:hypothetical protein
MRYRIVMLLGIVFGASFCATLMVKAEPPAKKVDPQPIAKVLGKSIFLKDLHIVEGDKTALRDYFAIADEILPPLVAKYIKDHKLEATDAEIAEEEEFMAPNEPKAPSKKKKPPKVLAPDHEVAKAFVGRWNFHKALHDKYGGRVVFQQAGIEPLDAYVKWLADEEKEGNFEILDPKWKAAFAEYFKPKYHRFLDENSKDYFKVPYWRVAKDAKEKADAR